MNVKQVQNLHDFFCFISESVGGEAHNYIDKKEDPLPEILQDTVVLFQKTIIALEGLAAKYIIHQLQNVSQMTKEDLLTFLHSQEASDIIESEIKQQLDIEKDSL